METSDQSGTSADVIERPSIVNVAAYKFVRLDELPRRRDRLRTLCRELGLGGTILISPEGINLFLAGERAAVDSVLSTLRRDPLLADLDVKESLSHAQPFRRMLVKVKREIIPCSIPGIDPASAASPKIAPQQLKRWLDEGRPVTLLDTRNDYEIEEGTFRGAIDLKLKHFRHFAEAAQQLPGELKDCPVVIFCTGGIRCEKAGPLLEREGFREVYQLNGGILKYFEECGEEHWEGDCFVFDERIAVDPQLRPRQDGPAANRF